MDSLWIILTCKVCWGQGQEARPCWLAQEWWKVNTFWDWCKRKSQVPCYFYNNEWLDFWYGENKHDSEKNNKNHLWWILWYYFAVKFNSIFYCSLLIRYYLHFIFKANFTVQSCIMNPFILWELLWSQELWAWERERNIATSWKTIM